MYRDEDEEGGRVRRAVGEVGRECKKETRDEADWMGCREKKVAIVDSRVYEISITDKRRLIGLVCVYPARADHPGYRSGSH